MHRHNIISSSSYSQGVHICIHLVDCDDDTYRDAITRIRNAYGGKRVPFSTHMIHTDSTTWDSVIAEDPYFEDMEVIGGTEEFVGIIAKDRFLSGLDVAKYILSMERCTHTRLHKLTYMCYADYLCSKGEKLFDDRIFAFEHGPVVGSVYSRYSSRVRDSPDGVIEDSVRSDGDLANAIKSRILFAEDGLDKAVSIDGTLKRYRCLSTEELVELTHREGSPWSVTDKCKGSPEISDEDIRRCHQRECLG